MEVGQHVSVRKIEPDDQQMAAPITTLTNRAYAPAILELWTAGFDRVTRSEISAFIAAGEMAVAEQQRKLVGSVQVRDIDPSTSWAGLLAVDPGSSGAGIGRTLIESAERAAASRGRRWMEMELLIPAIETPHQARLQAWYRRRGYVEVGRADFTPADPAMLEAMRSPCVSVRHRKRLR
jgi:GNAT superfamily N-acetyltransferase